MPAVGNQALLPGGGGCLLAREEPWGPACSLQSLGPGSRLPLPTPASSLIISSSSGRVCREEGVLPGLPGKGLGPGHRGCRGRCLPATCGARLCPREGGPRPDPGQRRAACHILVDSVQSQPWLLLWSGRERCGAGRPRRKLCRERRREPRRVQSRSWGSLGLPGWWGMRSRAWRLGPSAAGLQRVMNSRQEASRRKMQAKAMSTGRGAAASTGLPGVPVVGGLRPSVLMAPATGMGQKLRGKSAGPRPGEGNMGGGWALLNQQQVASQPFYSEAHRGDSLRSHSGKTMELGLNSGSVSLPASRGGARNFKISPHESQ